MQKYLFTFALGIVAISGCTTLPQIPIEEKGTIVSEHYAQPWIKPYTGGDSLEIRALTNFDKDIYPKEAISSIKKKEFLPVVWTGIIAEQNEWPMFGHTAVELIIEHRYWDWMSTSNDELIYISDRGEGNFRCFFAPTELQEGHEVGDFVIIYGIPWGIEQEKDYILFEGMRTKTLDRKYYTDEAWSYGSQFVRFKDLDDLEILDER